MTRDAFSDSETISVFHRLAAWLIFGPDLSRVSLW